MFFKKVALAIAKFTGRTDFLITAVFCLTFAITVVWTADSFKSPFTVILFSGMVAASLVLVVARVIFFINNRKQEREGLIRKKRESVAVPPVSGRRTYKEDDIDPKVVDQRIADIMKRRRRSGK